MLRVARTLHSRSQLHAPFAEFSLFAELQNAVQGGKGLLTYRKIVLCRILGPAGDDKYPPPVLNPFQIWTLPSAVRGCRSDCFLP